MPSSQCPGGGAKWRSTTAHPTKAASKVNDAIERFTQFISPYR
jgi:hypothetical protein